jgi:hypothetical protein
MCGFFIDLHINYMRDERILRLRLMTIMDGEEKGKSVQGFLTKYQRALVARVMADV